MHFRNGAFRRGGSEGVVSMHFLMWDAAYPSRMMQSTFCPSGRMAPQVFGTLGRRLSLSGMAPQVFGTLGRRAPFRGWLRRFSAPSGGGLPFGDGSAGFQHLGAAGSSPGGLGGERSVAPQAGCAAPRLLLPPLPVGRGGLGGEGLTPAGGRCSAPVECRGHPPLTKEADNPPTARFKHIAKWIHQENGITA